MTDPSPDNGHPQSTPLPASPGVRMALADGAAHCSAAPSALPYLPQRSPSWDPLHRIGALSGQDIQVLTCPTTMPEGTWSHMGAEPHHPSGGGGLPSHQRGFSVAWHGGSFSYDYFF